MEFSLESLLCQETPSCLDQEQGSDEKVIIDDQGDDEYVEHLIDMETRGNGVKKMESLEIGGGNWIQESRSDAIKYIIQTGRFFGYRIQTAYLSVMYLDRFLRKRCIEGEKGWAMRLLGMACLSLAAKRDEIKAPLLSQFPPDEYKFHSNVIMRMEILVLNTLEWKMESITPFTFTRYFAMKFSKEPLNNLMSTVAEVILGAMNDSGTMTYRPSVIAAAATLVALYKRSTREALELKIKSLPSKGIPSIEEVLACYVKMREMNLDRIKLPEGLMTPHLSPIRLLKIKFLENSPVTPIPTPATSSKRKRLTFDNSDEDHPSPDQKR